MRYCQTSPSRSRATQDQWKMKRLFRKKAAPRAHDKTARFCPNLVHYITKFAMKHGSRRSSGSEHPKSGSICGPEWIGDPLESRFNALRSGQIAAKTRFYHGKIRRRNTVDVAKIAVKHRGQTFTASRIVPTRAKSGSILRLSLKSILANKGPHGPKRENRLDISRLSGLMTHMRTMSGVQMSMVRLEVGES